MSSPGDFDGSGKATRQGYVWEPPEKLITVEVDFDVVDRLGHEIQRGVGGSARRGLEIGGLLLGWAEAGERISVHVEDYEPIPCSYASGPSYLIEGEDLDRFKERLDRWQGKAGTRLRAVGFFRAQTRDGLALQAADRDLLDRCFPEVTAIALLVKPFATRPPQAGIFYREEGAIRGNMSYREFPFRRAELGGGEKLEQTPDLGGQDEVVTNQLLNETPAREQPAGPRNGTTLDTAAPPASAREESRGSSVPARTLRLRGGWVWIPLSVIFLLVGTVLGFQVALSVQSKVSAGGQEDPYSLRLTATPSADSVHLRWDRASPAIQKAQRGVLMIREDGREKNIDLDAGHLRHGSVIYRQASNELRFRLEVYMGQQVTVAETIEYKPLKVTDSAESDG